MCMICSENDLLKTIFRTISYITQFFTVRFSSREPKCLKGVVVGNWDEQYL